MSRINIIALVAFVGLLVWIFLFGQDAVQRIQRGAMSVFSPMASGAQKAEDSIQGFGEKLSADELREMVAERDRLRLEVLRVDELQEENNALRDALNYVRNSPLQLVPARVISRKPNTWYNTLMIDKGIVDGIRTDSPVIVPVGDQAALVGKVSDVLGENTAVVILLSDETCQVSARIEGTTEQGILFGQRGALRMMPDLKVKYLSKDAMVEPGRHVISSGAGGLFPENLLLGKIKEFKPGAITGDAVVEAVVSLDVLKNVFVVIPESVEPVNPTEPSVTGTAAAVPVESGQLE